MIFKHYCKYGAHKALGFCCSRIHAEEMAKAFSKRGIPSVAVYSNSDGEYSENRCIAIDKLRKGEVSVIFSVDMFNEGVDIPSVDMVMFLRPTESPIVFMQQLGRGLRKSKGKEYLIVLDFIGNYEKAGRVRYYLSDIGQSSVAAYSFSDIEMLPDGCLIDFDMRLIDLFTEMDRKQVKIVDIIREEYYRVKEMIGRRPTRMDLFTYMSDDVYTLSTRYAKYNLFKDYLGFLNGVGELDEEEKALFDSIGREFIRLIENTNMSKVYKMPVLQAFYNNGDVRLMVTEQDLLNSWKAFFDRGANWKDLPNVNEYEQYKSISDMEHTKKIKDMPVHFLLESGKGYFVERDDCVLAIRDELKEELDNDAFVRHFGDVIEYRTMDYYRRRYMRNNHVGEENETSTDY